MHSLLLYRIIPSLFLLSLLSACNDSEPDSTTDLASNTGVDTEVELRVPVDESSPRIPSDNETQLPNEDVKPRDVIPVEYYQMGEPNPLLALADLEPAEGHYVSGMVAFIETENAPGIRVISKLSNAPFGKHGFHIHEFGDCSAPDASSAGGHFNPTDQPHGGRMEEEIHLGDLGNFEVVEVDGRSSMDIRVTDLTLRGENSLVGRAVVLHAQPDDLSTQPAGDAGQRLACGVIENYYVTAQ